MTRATLALVGPGGRLPLDRRTIEALATVFVGLLDIAQPDPEREPDGDEADAAWVEWDKMAPASKRGPNIAGHHEDDEESDPAEEDDGDSAVDDRPCDDINMDLEPDDDAERETWSHWMDHPAALHMGARPGHTSNQDLR